VIDEKGRLFGKINIVDLLVILLIVAAAVVLVLKFTGQKEEEPEKQLLVYTARAMEISQETYDNIRQFVDKEAGLKDRLLAGDKFLEGYIVDVEATPHQKRYNDGVGGDTLDLLFTIEALITDLELNKVGSQEIRIGKPHIIKSQHIEYQYGSILTCEWLDRMPDWLEELGQAQQG